LPALARAPRARRAVRRALARDVQRGESVSGLTVDRTRSPFHELEARYRQDSLDKLRAHLGDEQLERAYARGMALSLDQALDLALRKPGSA
jgi:nucleotide-binding universal stress UspA family protein